MKVQFNLNNQDKISIAKTIQMAVTSTGIPDKRPPTSKQAVDTNNKINKKRRKIFEEL